MRTDLPAPAHHDPAGQVLGRVHNHSGLSSSCIYRNSQTRITGGLEIVQRSPRETMRARRGNCGDASRTAMYTIKEPQGPLVSSRTGALSIDRHRTRRSVRRIAAAQVRTGRSSTRMKAVSEERDHKGASTVNRVHMVNATTTVGASRMGADRFQ